MDKEIIENSAVTSSLTVAQEEVYSLYDGRPDAGSCLPVEIPVYDFLDGLGVEYKTLKHPAAFTIEECRAVRDKVNAPVFKNLFLTNKQQTSFYLLLLPGEKIFKTKYLSHQIGAARLSFADAGHMQKYLGVTPGSVTPLGLLNDTEGVVKLLLDRDLQKTPVFACHPCTNTASIVMSLKDLTDTVLPATGHGCQWVTLPES